METIPQTEAQPNPTHPNGWRIRFKKPPICSALIILAFTGSSSVANLNCRALRGKLLVPRTELLKLLATE